MKVFVFLLFIAVALCAKKPTWIKGTRADGEKLISVRFALKQQNLDQLEVLLPSFLSFFDSYLTFLFIAESPSRCFRPLLPQLRYASFCLLTPPSSYSISLSFVTHRQPLDHRSNPRLNCTQCRGF